jgi:hypothetical protein
MHTPRARSLAAGLVALLASLALHAAEPVSSRFTFSWPVGPDAPAPRGGTTKGPAIEVLKTPSPAWQRLQEAGLSAFERDRRAILAMAGTYRVAFDFLEIAAFTGDGTRPRPYQSWGTEKVYVDEDDGRTIRLVHILEMRVVDKDGKVSEPMVTKHWRQDWHFEPAFVIEHQGKETWRKRALDRAATRGAWSQTVYQVDESPRYASVGRWEHNAAFSSWISADTARPLPRREWSVRKDYDFLWGTNRHTIVPTGWIQEENNLKATGQPGSPRAGAMPYVGREYGVARYERIADGELTASDGYYQSTRAFWNEVGATWERAWRDHSHITLKAPTDQSGEFAQLFDLADQFAAGKLAAGDVRGAIGKALRNIGVPARD